jgi:hypothetical protein
VHVKKEYFMGNIIFCFSGTGNSLAVARDIAERLGDTKIILIADAMKEEHIDLPYERVGFVCPAAAACRPLSGGLSQNWILANLSTPAIKCRKVAI